MAQMQQCVALIRQFVSQDGYSFKIYLAIYLQYPNRFQTNVRHMIRRQFRILRILTDIEFFLQGRK